MNLAIFFAGMWVMFGLVVISDKATRDYNMTCKQWDKHDICVVTHKSDKKFKNEFVRVK